MNISNRINMCVINRHGEIMNGKLAVLTIAIVSMFLLTNFATILSAGKENPSSISTEENIWSPEDEGDHFPCGCEWWSTYLILETENGARWDVSSTFQYETKNGTNISANILLLYFISRDSGKYHDFTSLSYGKKVYEEKLLSFKKNKVDLEYHNCTIKGLYPNYTMHFEEEEQRFDLDVQLDAMSLPHWAIQEGGNGYFPWGLGMARYGYIPRLNVSGNITIEGIRSKVTGVGYFEHAWGNFTYGVEKPLLKLKEFVKNLPILTNLARWYFSEQTINPSLKLKFTTNNIFGYDWAWATLDNGWSLHFGDFHMMNFIAEGPVPGVLSLTTDGKNYLEFADIKIKYGRQVYIEESDAYLPLDFEITATKGDKTLHLTFNSITDPAMVFLVIPSTKFSCGGGGMHSAGVVEGYYKDKEQTIPLNGVCTIGMFRQFFYVHQKGYRSLAKSSNIEEINYFDFFSNTTLYVGGNELHNYTRIQDAIDNASDGDTVFVYNGTYNENLLIDKPIHLIGENKENVIIKTGDEDGIKIISNNVEISGFTIDGEWEGNNWDDSAIDISSSGNFIHDNKIINSKWYGIYIYNSSGNIIENNIMIHNSIGIWLCRSNNNIIRHNNITISGWVGIWLWPFSENNIISYNNFIENKINIENPDKTCRNKFIRNYWDDYRGVRFKRLANLIRGGVGFLPYRISRFTFDWHPMVEKYKI